jgi:cytochrome c oxidase subunit 2
MVESFPMFPPQASTIAGEVDALYWTWIAVAAVSSLLVAMAVAFFLVRYRRTPEHQTGHPERAAGMLEVIWSVIPLVICLGMFAWGTKVFFDLVRPPADAVEYWATGKQWMWKFQHPNGRREINELHVPTGRPIKMTMISEDTIHSMFVPAFRVKSDVLPGRYTSIWFEPTKPGKYHLFCAEYCGTEHSLMGGSIYVMEPAAYAAWLAGEVPGAPRATGEELFTSLACVTCHQAGERQRGPALEGLFGTEVKFATGSTALADEAYVRESILSPGAKVVAGYDPLMPTYQGQVTEEQLMSLVDYIKSLGDRKAATTAPTTTSGGAPSAAPTGG